MAVMAVIVLGLITAVLGTTYSTTYSTITSVSYTTETTITMCHSASGVPPLPCTTSGTLVYTGTISYSISSTTLRTVVPIKTPSNVLNYLGGLIALVGASVSIIIILRRKKSQRIGLRS